MKRRAFTLIELLIVVAIIAILAAIAIPNFLEAQTRAKVSRAKSDMRTTVTGLEAYAVDHNQYPPPIGYIPPDPFTIEDPSEETFEGFAPFRITSPVAYLSTLPLDVFEVPQTDEHPKRVSWHYSEQKNNVRIAAANENFLRDLARDTGFGENAYQWMLFSHGPDLEHQDGDPGQDNARCHYDATNGTVSSGDLYYFGPGRGFK